MNDTTGLTKIGTIDLIYNESNRAERTSNFVKVFDLASATKNELEYFKIVQKSIKYSNVDLDDFIIRSTFINEVIDIYNVAKNSRTLDIRINVDHIIPVSFFDKNNIDHLLMCWDPRNLRLCTSLENSQKCCKIRPNDLITIRNSKFLSNIYFDVLGKQ